MRRVVVLNGPNLDLLGSRRPDVYGSTTLKELEGKVRRWADELGVEAATFQSNDEGELVDLVHAARDTAGLVVNPGALTHYSYALHDAIEAVGVPTVEVHISNIAAREPWRRRSVVAPACRASIFGRGVDGYRWALRRLAAEAVAPSTTVAYGPLPAHRGDLRRGGDNLALFVPGGFWSPQWGRDTIDPIAADLAARGFTTLTVGYRLVGSGGEWPGGFLDVSAALGWATQRLGKDGSRTVLVGHSAGGHLALLAARRAARRGVPPALVVSLAGVTDLADARARGLGDGAVDRFLAGADAEGASPRHLLPVGVPTLVVHARDDQTVPPEMSRRFAEAARGAGDTVEHLEPDGDHFAVIEPRHEAWQRTAELIVAHLA